MSYKDLIVLLPVLFLLAHIATGQERFKTTAGLVSIDASSPLEDIEAVNKKATAILDPDSGEIAVVLLIKDFEFRRKLMQEHFNENYMHSDTYPKALFSGEIADFAPTLLRPQKKSFNLSGEITIHGVTRNFAAPITLWQNGTAIQGALDFVIRSEDHNIKVPRVVFKKVAQEVNVSAEFTLVPQ